MQASSTEHLKAEQPNPLHSTTPDPRDGVRAERRNDGDMDLLGSPVRTLAAATDYSGMDSGPYNGPDQLEGHADFQIIRPLAPGASSSVLLCWDRRDQVQL